MLELWLLWRVLVRRWKRRMQVWRSRCRFGKLRVDL
jgi:hypothetical protein